MTGSPAVVDLCMSRRALGAKADWMAIFQEDVTGQPTTELGRLEADFFAARSKA